MDVSRRDVVVAGGLTLGASLLLSGTAGAQAGDEAAVTDMVEVLRKGLFDKDRAKLEQVAALGRIVQIGKERPVAFPHEIKSPDSFGRWRHAKGANSDN